MIKYIFGVVDISTKSGRSMKITVKNSPTNAKWEVDETDNRFLRFYADRDIKAGEELFHDYGEEYWTTRAED